MCEEGAQHACPHSTSGKTPMNLPSSIPEPLRLPLLATARAFSRCLFVLSGPHLHSALCAPPCPQSVMLNLSSTVARDGDEAAARGTEGSLPPRRTASSQAVKEEEGHEEEEEQQAKGTAVPTPKLDNPVVGQLTARKCVSFVRRGCLLHCRR